MESSVGKSPQNAEKIAQFPGREREDRTLKNIHKMLLESRHSKILVGMLTLVGRYRVGPLPSKHARKKITENGRKSLEMPCDSQKVLTTPRPATA